ncbi:MAG: hypothetical protein OR995_09155 [Candidatus Nanopelagicales bacterium]|jgi:hypothetical protein|nr:hypothetical protein [Candidatus Nanopelagicales bacterium]
MIEAVRVYQLRALRDSLSLRQIELVRVGTIHKNAEAIGDWRLVYGDRARR